ncbi:MAG: VOC family protein [Alphaproteobacteria bacterium]|nr:VOC family protein [Alphaproteobacteria bacterium]
MIDHIGIIVSDLETSQNFYTKALAPLGISVVMTFQGHIGMGHEQKPEFWFSQGKVSGQVHAPIHLAFVAQNRDAVQKFYQAALAAGGKDNGAPGLRPHYHPNYYGAFVIGPDGHNIEAVCHAPEA